MSDVKKRSPALAGFLTFVSPGLGFLYLGRAKWALLCVPIALLILPLGAWTKLIFLPYGLLAIWLVFIGFVLGSTVFTVVLARRQAPRALRGFQRWYVYLAFYILECLLWSPLMGNRATLMGYDMFDVPSRSMRETLLPGDRFISDTWKYRSVRPLRGELIVFRGPKEPGVKYIKRIIGLPGEFIQMRHGEVRVNGELLAEPYVTASNNTGEPLGDCDFHVPAGNYFVLGDNRDNSIDSRSFGAVPSENIHGSVEYIWFSYDAKDGLRTERIGQWLK